MKILLLLSHETGSTQNSGMTLPGAPISEAQALQTALAGPGHDVDVLNSHVLAGEASFFTRLVRRLCGQNAALAYSAFRRRRQYDVIFSNGEQVALPLALLFRLVPRRPAHVSVARRLTRCRAHWQFPLLGLRASFDALFVYTQAQRDFAEDRLGILGETVFLISPQVDDHFFRPCPAVNVACDKVAAAGQPEYMDPALCEAVAGMPDVTLDYLACTVEPKGNAGDELRGVFAHSNFVVVPLGEADSAGAAAILQAMAMGKAVITTNVEDRTDMIVEGVTGLTVLAGDVEGWRRAITRLCTDRVLRERLGHNARRWVEENAAQDRWARRIAETVRLAVPFESALSESKMPAATLRTFL